MIDYLKKNNSSFNIHYFHFPVIKITERNTCPTVFNSRFYTARSAGQNGCVNMSHLRGSGPGGGDA